ncbi:hypothetical protein LCGC14_2233940 [marine sediment metagenome]|uniref:Uncharacterized protein n=1 Tax=marine sediment metagenome TaxID=412755 RepID=A0A0F9FJX8_9ZZZZ|nr:hypothetical protein [bacterium]
MRLTLQNTGDEDAFNVNATMTMYFTYFWYGAHSLIIIYYLVMIDKDET